MIKSKWIAAIFLFLIMSVAIVPLTSNSVHSKSYFAVYYGDRVGHSVISYLNSFNMVIIQPWAFNTSTLSDISALKIAYIDLGEYDNSSIANCSVNVNSIAVGFDSQWDQVIINASSPLWEKYIICEVNHSIQMGFNGVLFDDLDDAQNYNFIGPGMIRIIHEVRQDFPQIIIGVNRGFAILPNISGYINFVLFEDYGTLVSGNTVVFLDNYSQVRELTAYVKGFHLQVLALGYAQRPEDRYFELVKLLARENSVPCYVTDVNVTALWNQ